MVRTDSKTSPRVKSLCLSEEFDPQNITYISAAELLTPLRPSVRLKISKPVLKKNMLTMKTKN